MGIIEKIKGNPKLKQLALSFIKDEKRARPRLWVRLFLLPFFIKKGSGVALGNGIRWDILPYHPCMVGENSVMEDHCILNNGMGKIEIGNRCLIGFSNVLIGPLTIGNNVITAQHVVMSGMNHGFGDIHMPIRDQQCTSNEITIGDDTWIGANVVVMAGVSIGKHCVIGAGSVVTKNIPDYSVAVGNPAKVIRAISAN